MKKKLINVFIGVIFFIVLILTLIRVCLGTEIADEAFYIAEALLVNQGGVPFVDNWTQAPGATITYAPLVRFFEIFQPSLDGIFFYMRICFWLYRVFIVCWIIFLFRKNENQFIILLSAIPLMAHFYSLLPSFSYTSIPLSFLFIVSVLVYSAWTKYSDGVKTHFAVICGVLMALATFSSPGQIVNCAVVLMIIALCFRLERRRYIVQYISGGMLTAILLTIYLLWNAGGLQNLLNSFAVLLFDNPYFKLDSTPFWATVKEICLKMKYPFKYYAVVAFIFAVKCLYDNITQKVQFTSALWKTSIGKAALWAAGIGLLDTIIHQRGLVLVWQGVVTLIWCLIICFFTCRKKELNIAFACIAVPEIVTLLIMALTVYGGIYARAYVLIPMCLFVIPYANYFFESNPVLGIKRVGIVAETALCVIWLLVHNYSYFYGDNNNWRELNTKVESGVYKGVYTTEQRATGLMELEKYITTHTDEKDKVLFMEVVPMAYLMTDAEYCAPTTWDAMLYSYGFNDDTIMQKYFEIEQEVPDKIIYIDTGRDEILSIEREDYKFNDFVNESYDFIEETDICDFRIKLYEKRVNSENPK